MGERGFCAYMGEPGQMDLLWDSRKKTIGKCEVWPIGRKKNKIQQGNLFRFVHANKITFPSKKEKKGGKECLSFLMVLFTEYSCTQRKSSKMEKKKREKKLGTTTLASSRFPASQPAKKEIYVKKNVFFFSPIRIP